MTWIDLDNPRPLNIPKAYKPYVWQESDIKYLSSPNSLPAKSISEVFVSRRTVRKFKTVTPQKLSDLLWLTSRELSWKTSELGFQLSQRPIPSAGAIHPIHILFANSNQNSWKRYVPQLHALREVKESSNVKVVIDAIRTIVPPEQGTLFLFVAEHGKTFAKYNSATSLIWRDAGVMLGALSLCAEALDLSFCPLGVTGEPWARELDKKGSLVGVGMAILGAF